MPKVRDIMTPDPYCVRPEDTVDQAAQLMKENHVGPVPVIDHEKRLVGIVTDRDLAIKVVAEDRLPRNTKIADVMTREPYSCGPNDDVEQIIQTMEEHQVRRVPIVDEGRHVLGIVAQADVATKLAHETTAGAVEEISQPSSHEAR